MNEIQGRAELRRVAALLREAGRKDLQRELYSGINRPVKPLREAVLRELGSVAPRGYKGTVVGSAQVKVSQRTTGDSAGVTIIATAKGKREKRDLAAINAGSLRHPLFGKREHWYTTAVRPGFFTRPAERFITDIRKEVRAAIERVAEKIERGA